MSTAIHNIERARGAAAERRAITAYVRKLLALYKKDLILEGLADWLKERDKEAGDV